MGIGFRQFGHRRLMGKPTGTQEQHAFIESAGETSNGFTQHAGTLETGQRRGDTVDEHRQNWHLIQPTEQELQRLGEPVMPPFCLGVGATAIGDFGSAAGELPVPVELAEACAHAVMKSGRWQSRH